jgi:hypothetical protein
MKAVIQSQDTTEVYASDAGYVCITQRCPHGDDPIVMFSHQNIDALCRLLKEAKRKAIDNEKSFAQPEGNQ